MASTLVVACDGASDGDKTGADTGGATDSGGEGGAGDDFSLPASACGADHAVLPPTGMGALIASERDPSLSLTAGAINALLASQGLDGVFTATHDVETYRVRYQTQDRGQPVEASGFVVLPKGAGAVPSAPPTSARRPRSASKAPPSPCSSPAPASRSPPPTTWG